MSSLVCYGILVRTQDDTDINVILRSWSWLPLGVGVRASVEWLGLSSASNYEWFRSALSYTAIGFPSDADISGELSQIPGCKTNEHEDKRQRKGRTNHLQFLHWLNNIHHAHPAISLPYLFDPQIFSLVQGDCPQVHDNKVTND